MHKKINSETFYLKKVGLDFGTIENIESSLDLKGVNDVLGSVSYPSRGCLINIRADWNALGGKWKENALTFTASGYTQKAIKDREVRIRMYSHHVEAYVYYCFLALNISLPGCFSPYLSHFYHPTFEEVKDDFKLSSDIYHIMINVAESNWPLIDYVPLNEVTDWLDRIGYKTKQVADKPIEKALFSFLNLSLVNDWFAEAVLWLSYCLEGLYDTPSFGIKKSLVDRISLVLGSPTNEQRKILGKFYDLRSSLVHGRMSICHPMNNEILDDDVNLRWQSEDIKSIALATRIVIASIQYLVKNRFSHLGFSEQFKGYSL